MSPSYKAIRSGRLYEQIIEQIEQQIVSGDLRVGDQLPSESELARQFQVSRTAVREAMKVLREKGLVEAQPGRGTFITDAVSQAVRQSLDFMIRVEQAEGYENLMQVRELLEPEINSLAAVLATDEHIVALREAVAAMDAALNDAHTFIEADLDFHFALAEATQNALVPILIDPIVGLLREQRMRIFGVAGSAERGQYHHKRILDTIIRRDPEAARDAMRAHLQQVREDSEVATAPPP